MQIDRLKGQCEGRNKTERDRDRQTDKIRKKVNSEKRITANPESFSCYDVEIFVDYQTLSKKNDRKLDR